MSSPSSDPVTVVVTRRVRPGREAAYEAWLSRLIDATRALPGFRGVDILRPPAGGHEYTALYRFDSVADLQGFEQSELRRRALAEVGDLVEADAVLRTMTGLEFWFDPPPGTVVAQPSRLRMAIVMIVLVWTLVIILGRAVNWAMPGTVFELRLLVTITVEVMLLTFVIMPRVTRLLAHWIYPRARAPGSEGERPGGAR